MKEYTLTRALVEIKLYDSKIEKAIKELNSVSYKVNEIVPEYRTTEADFLDEYNSQMQKIKDLRSNKSALKNALMKANAETKVKIADQEYTILEALNKKAEIYLDSSLVHTLSSQLKSAIAKANTINEKIESDIERTINAKSSSSGNQNKEYIQQVRESYKSQIPVLINDTVVENLIKTKTDEIQDFLAEVDFALSEINAITKIKVDLK
jgi:hypothetical protein